MDAEYVIRLRDEMMQEKCSVEYIERCCAYAQRLVDRDLPVIFDRTHLMKILYLSYSQMASYTTFYVRGKNKTRTISAPSVNLKMRQRWILDEILSKESISHCVHGFVKGRSIVTNARQHINQKFMLNIDIKDFFPSISEDMVVEIFRSIGYSHGAAAALADVCCYRRQLPQGAVTSPYLSNLIFRKIDAELLDYTTSLNCRYSRYADDITISGNIPMETPLGKITAILEKHGFSLNEQKTRIYGETQVKRVTGLVVSDRVRIPKQFKRALKKELYFCRKFGAMRHLENISATKYVNFQEHIYGKIYYVNAVEPAFAKRLLKEADTIIWT